ncbi:hypothetical protein [Sphingobacterium wenxiniae]|uniref:Lipocalin-like domain-containing protein n=1 Tax=Sphingobacterium wenxiniae TaxID=683125 RepID=A0A1I6VR92_9SPHI|nr:hypothetical protein [Sphingobacterium wenxiniae]SFT15944.1 hypothetical protein SAMN05660206_11634 [Sphingobacterium wenxiniae]
MKFNLVIALTILVIGVACAQSVNHKLNGIWYVVSKTETLTEEDTVIDIDEDIYERGEKIYHIEGNTLTIIEGAGKHKMELPIKVSDEQLYLGKIERKKEPYHITLKDNELILTKIKIKGGNQRLTEVVTLEKQADSTP